MSRLFLPSAFHGRLSLPQHRTRASFAPISCIQTGHSWSRSLCDSLEASLDECIRRQMLEKQSSSDTSLFQATNFSPVDELPPTPCVAVTGTIPSCLHGGAYIRNGPNPRHVPDRPHHVYDGEGMLHSLFFLPTRGSENPTPILCSRYSRSSLPLSSVSFGLRGFNGLARVAITLLRILSGQMDPVEGWGPANVAVSFLWDEIFVLGETDPPFPIYLSPRSGDLHHKKTEREKKKRATSAHHKKDRTKGESFALNYGLAPPFLWYYAFDSEGNSKVAVPVWSVNRPSVFHDFAVTERYAIIPETQLEMDPFGMAFLDGPFLSWKERKVPRVGVMPRYPSSGFEMKWFDVPGFNPLHVTNAWEEEEGDEVVIVGSWLENMHEIMQKQDLVRGVMEMVRINLKTSAVTRLPLCPQWRLGLERINPLFEGRRNRYIYAAMNSSPLKFGGVAKLDLWRWHCVNQVALWGEMSWGRAVTVGSPSLSREERTRSWKRMMVIS